MALFKNKEAMNEIELSCRRLLANTRIIEAVFNILMDPKSDEETKKQARFEMLHINSAIHHEVYEIRHYMEKI